MKLAVTCTEMDVRKRAPIVFRGKLEDSFKKIKNIGYDGVEVHIHDSSAIDRKELKALLNQYGLELTSIGTGSAYGKEGLFITSEDKQIRDRALEFLKQHFITASEYHHAVVIIGLIKGKVSDCSSKAIYERNLIESLNQCIEIAKKYNVVLGIEVLNRYESDYLNTIDEGLELLDKINSEHLKLHIDTFHMNIEEANIGEAIRKAKDKICHVHIADSDRWYAGHGHYNFIETIEALHDIGYSHALAIESLNYPDANVSGEYSYNYLRGIIYERIKK
jgi:sugar phosphate isomerase/epimerase